MWDLATDKAITARAMRGEIDFADACVERVGLMSGLMQGIDSICASASLHAGGKALVPP